MTLPTLKVKKLHPKAVIPSRGHSSDAGCDLTVIDFKIRENGVFLFQTGLAVSISEGFYTEIVPRSSIIKTDFALANSIGIIDPDYRGELMIPFRFLGKTEDAEARAKELVGTRVAQLLVRRLELCKIEECEELDETARGTGGFGSTGS